MSNFDIFIVIRFFISDCLSFTSRKSAVIFQSIPVDLLSRCSVASFAEGVSLVGDLALVLSTIPKKYFSTHLLATEDRKPAVMLRAPVGDL